MHISYQKLKMTVVVSASDRCNPSGLALVLYKRLPLYTLTLGGGGLGGGRCDVTLSSSFYEWWQFQASNLLCSVQREATCKEWKIAVITVVALATTVNFRFPIGTSGMKYAY